MEARKKREFEKYIEECNKVIESEDMQKASELSDIIINVFKSAIKDIHDGLENYESWGDTPVNHIKDIQLLKKKITMLC